MPLDLVSYVKNGFSNFSTKTFMGDAIANPIILSILIIFVIVLIRWIQDDSDTIEFKFVFYSLICTLGLVILHQNVIKQRYKDEQESHEIGLNIPQMDNTLQNIQPRPVNDIPDLPATFGAAPNREQKNYPGYTNLLKPNQIPIITSSDDLLRYVQST